MGGVPELGAVVVGGGVAGLAAALELQRDTREVLVVDANDRPGGLLRTDHVASDAWLVEQARRGDRDAFGELALRYERRLMRVLLRFVHDVELAQDLAQETFLRVWERLDQFDTSRRFGPWLFRIGVNLTMDFLRRRKRRGRWALALAGTYMLVMLFSNTWARAVVRDGFVRAGLPSNTRFMVFKVPRLVSEFSLGAALEPGDVIITGTPEGVGFARKPPEFLKVGDTVEVEIEGIGVLRNSVQRRS